MTTKDLIAERSTLGNVLRMMPSVSVDADTLQHAVATKSATQRVGERLVEMRVISQAQLDEALKIQEKIRKAKNVEEFMDFIDEVQREGRRARTTVEMAAVKL